MIIKQKINITKYNNIYNTGNYTNTEPSEKVKGTVKRIEFNI